MSEEGFQYGRAAAYETGVDLDDTVQSQRRDLGEGVHGLTSGGRSLRPAMPCRER